MRAVVGTMCRGKCPVKVVSPSPLIRCVITQHNMGCISSGSKNTLTKALCGNADPKKCPEIWGVFNYMPNWPGGECGVKNGSFCVSGKNTIASPVNTYYALCATAMGNPELTIL